MLVLGMRAAAVVLWTAAIVLMIVGSHDNQTDNSQQLAHIGWSIITAVAAATLTAWALITHHTENEADRNAHVTADAVMDAVMAAVQRDPDQQRATDRPAGRAGAKGEPTR